MILESIHRANEASSTFKQPGAMKIYPGGIYFFSVHKSLCDLGQVSYYSDFSFSVGWTIYQVSCLLMMLLLSQHFLRSGFINVSTEINLRSCLFFSFVGSWERMLQKMTVILGATDLIFGKTKWEIIPPRTKKSYRDAFPPTLIPNISMKKMGNFVRKI